MSSENSSQTLPSAGRLAADVAVVGAGVIGLSCALELRRRGASVIVLERRGFRRHEDGQASWAAAGMLAAQDPHNPVELAEMARWSAAHYDEFLTRVRSLSRQDVRFQTHRTLQIAGDGSEVLDEKSIDPRELMSGLQAAAERAGIGVRYGAEVTATEESATEVRLCGDGLEMEARAVLWANGAWGERVRPRKGQMLRVRMPANADPGTVLRSEAVYIVPRNFGPQAGTALIGATVEDAGYDLRVDPAAIQQLRAKAAELAGWAARAPEVETWVGLRPATADGLPVLSAKPGTRSQFLALGHFRNGILLAPATAWAMADLIEGNGPGIDVSAFRAR